KIIRPYGRLKLPMTIVTGYNNTSGGCVSEEPQTTGGTAQLTEQASFKYAGATAQVAAMTREFFSGLGPGNLTLGPNSSTSQVHYMTGQTSGLCTFGLPGLVSAGGNPVAQFVGSFRWSITPGNEG